MHTHDLKDTIAAIATGAGESGIGIVRISGQDALAIADRIFLARRKGLPSSFRTFTTHYGWIAEGIAEGTPRFVDEVLLTVMRAPASYTREDTVEINCHGGMRALRRVLEVVLAQGCRLAEPGEFTKRAFLNGRIDLAQAEAVLDIIKAKTDAALEIGTRQLRGVLSKKVRKVRGMLLEALTAVEAGIDFPEDTGAAGMQGCGGLLKKAAGELEGMLRGARLGRIFREGACVVICGRPNVGKSSLLNALLEEERSIVTAVAGTTRDTIEEVVDIKGMPVRVVDTAGIVRPRGVVERKAVERSRRSLACADVVIALFDAGSGLTAEDRALMRRLKGRKALAVINKIDLKRRIEEGVLRKRFGEVIGVSARSGANIDRLKEAIAEAVYAGGDAGREPLLVSNLRHAEKLRRAQKFVAEALDSVDNKKLSPEFVAQDLRDALQCLDELLGERFSEDLLEKIFSEFCIGK